MYLDIHYVSRYLIKTMYLEMSKRLIIWNRGSTILCATTFILCIISEAVIFLNSSWHCHHLLKNNLHIMPAKYFRVAHGSCSRGEPPLGYPLVEQGRCVVYNPEVRGTSAMAQLIS